MLKFTAKLCGVALLLLTSLPSYATLGAAPLIANSERVASVVLRQPPMATASAAFEVHTATLASGTTVTEFVATGTNQVFALSWSGPAMPDLKEILGVSFQTFVSAPAGAAALRLSGPSGRLYSSDSLVVRSHGAPGHFIGYAYLPASFPAGVTVQSLRQPG